MQVWARLHGATARLLALAALVVLGLWVVQPPSLTNAARTFDIDGTVECGRRSGDRCAIGTVLAIRTDDVSGTVQLVTIDMSWIWRKLPTLDQDDLLILEVEETPDGGLRAVRIVEREGHVNRDRRNDEDKDKDNAPASTGATSTPTASRVPSGTPTQTPSPTTPSTSTLTPTSTATSSPTPTSAATFIPSGTQEPTSTATATPTASATATATSASTATATATATATTTMTSTATSTATATPTVVVPSVGIADAPAVLEGGVSTFTVTLSQATTRSVSIEYATASGSATGGGIDFTSASESVTIPAGSTTGMISVQTIDELLFEPTELFAVNLSAPTNATLGRAQATGSILSDDAEVTISIGDAAQVIEGGSLTFLVSLSRPAPEPDGVSVAFATADGTANAPADYAAQAGTLTFASGQQQRQIVVVTTGDSLNEAAETVLVNLTTPVGASIADGQGTGTIADDDGPEIRIVESARASEPLLPSTGAASFDVFLSFPSAGTVTVQYAAQDSTGPENATGRSSCAAADYIAISGATLTFSPGQTTRTIAVTICGDVEEEPEETFNVVLSAPTGATLGSSVSTGFIRDTPQNP